MNDRNRNQQNEPKPQQQNQPHPKQPQQQQQDGPKNPADPERGRPQQVQEPKKSGKDDAFGQAYKARGPEDESRDQEGGTSPGAQQMQRDKFSGERMPRE